MADRTRGTHCTVQRHTGDFCDAPAAQDMPFPICARHAAKLYRHIAETMAGLASDPLFMLRSALKDIEEKREQAVKRRTAAPGDPPSTTSRWPTASRSASPIS